MPGKKATASVSVESILERCAPDQRAIVESLRALIRNALPLASESAHGVWQSINYRHPESGYICAIFPRGDVVQLVFEWGILLPDPQGILEGTGKQVRSLPIREGDLIPEDSIRKLLLAALTLPTRRAEKLALAQAVVNVQAIPKF